MPDAVSATGSQATYTATTSVNRGDQMGKDTFLKLLVAQMRYQDPMNPTDSSEFLSQSAQFTALEKMSAVAEQTSQLVALQVSFGASSMVGRTVSYPLPDGSTAQGVVRAVRFTTQGPMLDVDGQEVDFADVIAVGDGTGDLTTPETPDPPAEG